MEQQRDKKNWTNELLFEKEQLEQGRKLLFHVLTKIYFRFFLYKNPKSKSTWICISYMFGMLTLHRILSLPCNFWMTLSFQLSVMDTSGSFFWLRVESYILSYSLLYFHHNLISSLMLILSSHNSRPEFPTQVFLWKLNLQNFYNMQVVIK